MKKLALLLVFVSLSICTFAQETSLDKLKSKIKITIKHELYRFSDFGIDPKINSIDIINVTEDNGLYIVDGEFGYLHYVVKTDFVLKSIKYQATVKVILDDFSVIKVIWEQDGEWYRLFPANVF